MEPSTIEKIIWEVINERHHLGEGAGGSGHLARLSADLISYETKEVADGGLAVTFEYVVLRESEFTVYGEHEDPGMRYQKSILIRDGKVVKEEA